MGARKSERGGSDLKFLLIGATGVLVAEISWALITVQPAGSVIVGAALSSYGACRLGDWLAGVEWRRSGYAKKQSNV